MSRDGAAWHDPCDEPGSSLHRRLVLVQRRIREALDGAPHGPIRVISMCAGQGRDLLGVLPDHPRRDDVVARLVELDESNVAHARGCASAEGLGNVDVVEGDASVAGAYAGMVPADLVLVCGVFGNVTLDDIRNTVENLRRLCRPGGTVIWTRHRRPPDATVAIRRWFVEAGFVEVAFDAPDGFLLGVGSARFEGPALPFVPGLRLFEFTGDGAGASF